MLFHIQRNNHRTNNSSIFLIYENLNSMESERRDTSPERTTQRGAPQTQRSKERKNLRSESLTRNKQSRGSKQDGSEKETDKMSLILEGMN